MATAGPNLPTAATGNTNTIGGGTKLWSTPTNIEAADGTNTTVAFTGASTSNDLIGTGFGFAIPSTATINGITLQINYTNTGGGGLVTEKNVRLLKAGVATGADKQTAAVLPLAATTVTYGGAADLWSTTWTPADVNASNFGAAFVCTASGGDSAGVDFFKITVTYTLASGKIMIATARRLIG